MLIRLGKKEEIFLTLNKEKEKILLKSKIKIINLYSKQKKYYLKLINSDLKTNRLIKIKKMGILLRYFIKGYIFKYVRALKLIYW